MVTLNTVFKQVFGEGLKEDGFVKIKGRQPYLVRVIGDEMIQVIACRPELDLSCCPRKNLNRIRLIRYYYSKFHSMDYRKEIQFVKDQAERRVNEWMRLWLQ